jgi:signal transduction histidine kinase
MAGLLACLPVGAADGTSARTTCPSDLDVAEDAGNATVDEISVAPAGTFRPHACPANLGLKRSVYWFRLNLTRDQLGDGGPRIISLGALLDHVDAYASSDQEAPRRWERLEVASLASSSVEPVAYNLPGTNDSSLSLLFRVETLDTLLFSPVVKGFAEYRQSRSIESLHRGLYYGVMLGAIVYNLFLSIWLRDRAYALYVIFQTALCVTMAGMDRTLGQVFPSMLPAIRDCLTERLMGVTGIATVLFTIHFLDLRTSRPVNYAFRVTVVAGLGLMLFPLSLGRQVFYAYGYGFCIGATLVVASLAMLAWRRNNPNAPLFLLAWGTLLSVTLLGSLMNLGMVMPDFEILDALRVGSAAEATLLSVALARRMNLMKRAQEKAQAALVQAKLELAMMLERQVTALNTLVGGVAHEIGNPLNFARGGANEVVVHLGNASAFTETLPNGPQVPDIESLRSAIAAAQRSAALVTRGTERIDGIVKNLRTFVGTGIQPLEWTNLNESIRGTLTLLENHLNARQIKVNLDLAAKSLVRCRTGEMNQVMMNLVLNACQAMPHGGELAISSIETSDSIRVVVTDTGPGVPPELRNAIFDPFFTTRPPNEGTGMGLAVSLEIMRRHGGRLDLLASREGEAGAQFSLTLPLSP